MHINLYSNTAFYMVPDFETQAYLYSYSMYLLCSVHDTVYHPYKKSRERERVDFEHNDKLKLG